MEDTKNKILLFFIKKIKSSNINFGNYYYTSNDGYSFISTNEISIIPDYCFGSDRYSNSLIAIVIPESITSIGKDSFKNSSINNIHFLGNNISFKSNDIFDPNTVYTIHTQYKSSSYNYFISNYPNTKFKYMFPNQDSIVKFTNINEPSSTSIEYATLFENIASKMPLQTTIPLFNFDCNFLKQKLVFTVNVKKYSSKSYGLGYEWTEYNEDGTIARWRNNNTTPPTTYNNTFYNIMLESILPKLFYNVVSPNIGKITDGSCY